MATNSAPLPGDLFLYSYELIQKFIKDNRITKRKTFNVTFRYIDDDN
jgi:hypothetical protein